LGQEKIGWLLITGPPPEINANASIRKEPAIHIAEYKD
jgi:hypothetical protein